MTALRCNSPNLAALAAGAWLLAVASCGGGSGAAAGPIGALTGRLVLEQSPAALMLDTAPGGGLLEAAATHRDREPNDHPYTAVDLGRGEAAVVDGRTGGGDARDVFRVERYAAGGVGAAAPLLISLDSAGATLRCFTGRLGDTPCFAQALHGSGSLVVADALAEHAWLVVTGPSDTAYRLVVEPESQPVPVAAGSGHRAHLTRAALAPAALHDFAAATGAGEVALAAGEIVIDAPEGLGAACAATLGLTRIEAAGGVERWRSAAVAALADAGAREAALADLLRAVRRALPGARYVSANATSCAPCALPWLPALGAGREPNDPLFATDQFNLQLTRFPDAWDLTTGDDTVTIAVMDTGILAAHPDLAPRISALGYDFVSDKNAAGDGDGPDPDPSEPLAFETKTLFHGTWVAGVIGAVSDNGIGVAGGTWRGKIMPLRIIGAGADAPVSTSFDRIQALRYAGGLPNASNRILSEAERPRVLNMSFVIPPTLGEKIEIERLHAAGVLLIAAAGNNANKQSPPVYPAAWPEVIAVGSVDRNLASADYSNGGSFVDVVAPGGSQWFSPDGVITTFAGTFNQKFTYGYHYVRGTSIATPCVSAAAALMEALHPGMDPRVLRQVLEETSRDLGVPGRDDLYGHGLLDAAAAAARARDLAGPPSLAVAPQTLGLAFTTGGRLEIRNAGGRVLRDLGLRPHGPTTGAVTLSLAGTVAPTTVDVSIDHAKVAVGSFEETWEVVSNAGSTWITIRFARPIPAPHGTLVIRVLDGERVVAEQHASAGSGEFAFDALPAGSFVLEAGVDRDANGRLGDAQEWYLRRPVVIENGRRAQLDDVTVPWKT